MTSRSEPYWAVLLAKLVAPEHRDSILYDLLDDYQSALAKGANKWSASGRLIVQLLRSAGDSWRQRRADRTTATGPRASAFTAMTSDFRGAWRQHIRRPVSTLSAVATIALAIGVNTAFVSVTHAVLLKPLPFRDAQRVVFVWDERAGQPMPFAPARALDVRRRSASLESAALIGHVSMTVLGLGPPERWAGASVSAPFFDVLGAQAALGRTFHESDRGADLVVLSHRLWTARFGGDPSIVGRALMMNGQSRTVAGVMGPDFFWPSIVSQPSMADGPDFWTMAPADDVPESMLGHRADAASDRRQGFVRMVARMAPGATPATARAEWTSLIADLGRQYPATDGGHGLLLRSVDEQFFGGVQRPVWFLMSASALVVLLACVNVATLLVMRLPARARELAVRVALGAGRARLVRQLLVESCSLTIVGGAVGVLLAWLSLHALVSLAPPGVARLGAVAISAPVLAVTAAAVLGCGIALGALPAWIVWRARPMLELRAAGVSLATRPRLRQTLVALEVALAVALVIGAALFGESLVRLKRVDVGFDTSHLLTFDVALVGDHAKSQAAQAAFFDQVVRAIRTLPGVRSAGGAVTLPIGGDDFGTPLFAEGEPLPPPGAERHVGFQIVSSAWFQTLGIRLIAGRDFSDGDVRGSTPVVIVNRTLADRLWPGLDPIGRRVRGSTGPDEPWSVVVGVVSDIHHLGPAAPPRPEIYQPYSQESMSFLAVAVRSDGDPLALVGPIRAAVARLDPSQPISEVATMSQHLSRAYAEESFLSTLTLGFGTLALALAVIGVYGVVGWSSAQRAREFSLRTALGATPRGLSALVFTQGLWPVVVGVVAGAATALGLAQAVRGLLFDTAPADPAMYVLAVTAVMVAASLACWIPARRASRTDPVRVLRAES
jgi:putative ABC transport system permease protein